MDDFYQFIFVILLYVIGSVINRVAKGKQDKAMQELAIALSLDYIEGGLGRRPRIAGAYEGLEVMVENIVRSRRREKKVFYRIVMRSHAAIPDSIRVHNSLSFGPITDLFSEIGEFFGVHDIPFDNSVFDEKFVIRGRNEGIVKAIIDPSVQEALISIGRVNLVIQDDEIIYEDEGDAPENESRIRNILLFESRIANQMAEVMASGIGEIEDEEEAPVSFKPKPQPGTIRVEAEKPHVTVDLGRIYRVASSDVVALRSDYTPQLITPEQLITQLKNEGYYGGD